MNILVIGKAKTGTTVISKAISNALTEPVRYFMEPKDMAFFQTPNAKILEDTQVCNVVKVIFEHWSKRNNLLNEVVHNQAPFQFDKLIFIARDLRDEIISRILYYAYAIYHDKPDYKKIQEWITVLSEKENNPSQFSCLQLARKLGEIFEIDGEEIIRGGINQARMYSKFLGSVKQPYLLVKYEEFLSGNIKGLENYLGFNLKNTINQANESEGGMKVAGNDNTLNIVKRSATFNNWKSFFTEEDVAYFKPQIADILDSFDYSDWALSPADKLESAHYSGYIKRIFNLS